MFKNIVLSLISLVLLVTVSALVAPGWLVVIALVYVPICFGIWKLRKYYKGLSSRDAVVKEAAKAELAAKFKAWFEGNPSFLVFFFAWALLSLVLSFAEIVLLFIAAFTVSPWW